MVDTDFDAGIETTTAEVPWHRGYSLWLYAEVLGNNMLLDIENCYQQQF